MRRKDGSRVENTVIGEIDRRNIGVKYTPGDPSRRVPSPTDWRDPLLDKTVVPSVNQKSFDKMTEDGGAHIRSVVEDNDKKYPNLRKLAEALEKYPRQKFIIDKAKQIIRDFVFLNKDRLEKLGVEKFIDPEHAIDRFVQFLTADNGMVYYHPGFYSHDITEHSLELMVSDAILKFPEEIFIELSRKKGGEILWYEFAHALDESRR